MSDHHLNPPPPVVSEYPDWLADGVALPDPEVSRRRFEDEPVGPHGETRAQMRVELLRSLDELRDDVNEWCDDGSIDGLDAIKLRLRIHTQRCALLGLSWGGGDPW